MNRAPDFQFEGIVFKHTSGWGVDGYNWGSESAVRMVSTDNAVITDCKFTQGGLPYMTSALERGGGQEKADERNKIS